MLSGASAAAMLVTGCASNTASSSSGTHDVTQTATPTITATSTGAQNGAKIVTLADADSGAKIFYTVDGSTPTTSSPVYNTPFLVARTETINAVALVTADRQSEVATQTITLTIPSGTLVWSDEFDQASTANVSPSSSTWTYDTGAGGWGNSELETYCAAASSTSPCSSSSPNAYVSTDGNLHIEALNPSSGVYTSARMKTTGLFSFQYGRAEVRAKLPVGQGLWPAFWLLGNNYGAQGWPAGGELDVMEHIDAQSPDWVAGSIHGTGFDGSTDYYLTSGDSVAEWHTYGMIWQKGSVSFYVDNPANIYATYSASSYTASGQRWPFDNGQSAFMLLNLAVGGSWPGNPDSTTVFPAEMLVDYVRIYTNTDDN